MFNINNLEERLATMNVSLIIQHGDKPYIPIVEEGITWTTERKGCPGTLQFNVVKDDIIDFAEGDAVSLKVDDAEIFYGFVFKKKRDKEHIISVTAYDQLRYFKNKDTYVYENKTAGELVQMIINDHFVIDKEDEDAEPVLQVGEIEDTGFVIATRTEPNISLFDMVQNALDITLQNKNEMYVLYDDFGKITLKNIANMQVNILIDEETGENFDYTSSIDDNTYNRVKLTYDNEDTKKRDVYIAQDSNNMNRWGILQYYDTLKEGENGQAKADALLSLYNVKTRNLSINNAFGDVRVRAGSLVPVMLNLGDTKVQNMMLVEKCKHEFKNGQHLMNLTLRGGEFVA
jgi:hypothetical protein